MLRLTRKRKKIAIALLVLWVSNMAAPGIALALTSGPAQPETKGFQVAGVSDMVDLQTGQLHYNIPLLDIDGYPINLNYESGQGMDDEASWVGLGWNLNPGAVNRQVRGLPDDFSGDQVETDHYVNPKVTVGGKLTAKAEYSGLAKISGSFTFGIFSDNYTGIGAELGANAGISYAMANDGMLTAGLGAGVLSNTQSGVDASVSPYVSLSIKENADNNLTTNAGLSGSFGYNTRSGLKGLTLGTSFGLSNSEMVGGKMFYGGASYTAYGSSISYNTEPVLPKIQVPFTSDYSSFSFDVGGEVFGLSLSGGGTGYQNVRQVKTIYNPKPAFGFLYAERGKNNQDALMDFIRENDNPVIPTIPDIAIPIHTPDLWTYTSQTGQGQFRLYRGGSGAFFDNQAQDGSTVGTTGGDIGVGGWAHGGVTHYSQNAKTTTRKWSSSNNYLVNGDFQAPVYNNPGAEHAYFRQIGEKNIEDVDADVNFSGTKVLQVDVQGTTANSQFRYAGNLHGTPLPVTSPMKKTIRRPNRTMISYLTAAEAKQGGLDTAILNARFNDISGYPSLPPSPVDTMHSRVDRTTSPDSVYVHKPHHISELTVTTDDGKRMIYGTPVYNIYQDEYTFAVDRTTADANNLVTVPSGITSPTGNTNGLDHYYHKEHKPSYATSYLLTAILSPDYVDRTGNGITDDDLGTAIKFHYSKLPYYYKWRSPYTRATHNRGLMADPDDDKGTIIYGKKEIWYVQSIESKTKIAYFITQDRRDAAGVRNWMGGSIDTTNKQKCLREIRLYSKADMTKPIKVVKFQYTYELCRGIPNSIDAGNPNPLLAGKLTLSRVWFEYGNSDKGRLHPYIFTYNESTSKYAAPVYAYNSTDRWGIYKPATENKNSLGDEQYPYTNQDTTYTNQNVALWQLSKISLPTGGYINVSYESGDYAYVQNQKAMVMTGIRSPIKSLNPVDTVRDTTRLLNAMNGLRLYIGTDTVPPAGVDQTAWFKNTFLNGSNYLYAKLCVKMSTTNSNAPNLLPYDYVPTYCQVQAVSVASGSANIMLTPITADGVTVNPVSISAWQRMKNEYPRYAYPGFDNRIQSPNNSVLAAVTAIANAAKNLSELKMGFYQKANRRNYATSVIWSQSFVKLAKTKGFKIGGPARVKMIRISDNWKTVDNPSVAETFYGQTYAYTTKENGRNISSGVATYEPGIGNDENALKQPVPYIENIKGAINNYFDLEMPFGESLYPAPSVGYSRVTVSDLDKTGTKRTGYTVNEFYTAKDFPVKVSALPIIRYSPRPSSYYSLTRTDSDDELCLSQGFSIELNDMHGKPKSITIYNQADAVISSTAYYYNTTDNGGILNLNNNVNVVDPTTLLVSSKVLGRDVDFFTDFREQEMSNKGQAINVGVDVFPIPPFLPAFALPHFPVNDNNDYKLFRSVCAVKTIQNYGILSKVVKIENGSSITTENLAYDAVTGEAIVTRTKNEFKQPIYSVNIPAYWAYKGMGAAYQNLGVLIYKLATNTNGEITAAYANYLQAGDEIIDEFNGNHYWVIENQAVSGVGTSKKLIDRNGTVYSNYTSQTFIKIIRSGYRNMLAAGTATLVSMNSPFTSDNHLQLISNADLTTMKVINASATTYDESWSGSNCCTTKKFVQPATDPILNTVLNTSRDFSAASRTPNAKTVTLTDSTFSQGYFPATPYWGNDVSTNNGRLGKISFWPSEASSKTYHTGNSGSGDYYGFDTTVTFPSSKYYYFLVAGPFYMSVTLDCNSPNGGHGFSSGAGATWYYGFPIKVTAGKHIVHFAFALEDSTTNVPLLQRCAGFEIYNNTLTELVNANSTGSGLNVLFSTINFVGRNHVYSFFDVHDSYNVSPTTFIHQSDHFTRPDGAPVYYNYSYLCSIPPDTTKFPVNVNPYITGYLGNWRAYQTKVFQQSRNYTFATNMTKPGIDIRNAGYVNNYFSYLYLNTATSTWTVNPNGARWVTANTVSLYDKYGQQLENKDALGRYSAAKFDFYGELPSAVASNAQNREIYAASLEDSHFTPGSAQADTCNVREFIQPTTHQTLKQLAVNTIAHSGNYSALLPTGGVTMTTIIDTVHQKTVPYLALDARKQYMTQISTALYPNGFEPYSGKKYLFDTWVNDGLPNDKSVHITLNINGNNIPLTCKAVVEGWKLMEGTMDLSTLGSATTLNIALSPTGANPVYVDDIRMHPFDAQLKSYAYDDKTMRLMAELDENGFATFYEYDDEGLLVRVKKETEKGIMTIKESRSTYRRNNK